MGGETLYMTIALTRGVVGLIAVLGLLYAYLSRLRNLNNDTFRRTMMLATFVYAIASIPTEAWFSFQSGFLFWFFMGVSMEKISIADQRRHKRPNQKLNLSLG